MCEASCIGATGMPRRQLLAVWTVATLRSRPSRGPFQLVELGPGRATLMSDMLRVRVAGPSLAAGHACGTHQRSDSGCTARMGRVAVRPPLAPCTRAGSAPQTLRRFPDVMADLQAVHLVEVSPTLRAHQQRVVSGSSPTTPVEAAPIDAAHILETRTPDGLPVAWHSRLVDVPHGIACASRPRATDRDGSRRMGLRGRRTPDGRPGTSVRGGERTATSVLIAHEFVDALPIHQFQVRP